MRLAGLASIAVAALVLAGCTTAPEAAPPQPAAPPPADPSAVVVAVIDTGINLYHSEFRRAADVPLPKALAAAEPVSLSLGASDFDAAVEADMDRLLELETEKLYRFPGTKILAISFGGASDGWPIILDEPDTYAHGTMTASRAVGNTVSIAGADDGVWLVLVQGFSTEAVRWASDQPWIDIVSISAGISPFSFVPGVPNALDDGGIAAYNHASHRKPFFASSGNGLVNAGVLGFPAVVRGSSGVPDAVSVGANDNDHLSHWHNQGSYIAADGCGNPRASPRHLSELLMDGGGTSSATPFSAGGGAALLLEARRLLNDTAVGPRAGDGAAGATGWSSGRPEDHSVILAQGAAGAVADGPLADGLLSLHEFKDVLYHTALAAPTEDESDGLHCAGLGGTFVPGSAVPEAGRFALQGYGEVNHASIAAAVEALAGAPVPARGLDDQQYALMREAKVRVVGDREG